MYQTIKLHTCIYTVCFSQKNIGIVIAEKKFALSEFCPILLDNEHSKTNCKSFNLMFKNVYIKFNVTLLDMFEMMMLLLR